MRTPFCIANSVFFEQTAILLTRKGLDKFIKSFVVFIFISFALFEWVAVARYAYPPLQPLCRQAT